MSHVPNVPCVIKKTRLRIHPIASLSGLVVGGRPVRLASCQSDHHSTCGQGNAIVVELVDLSLRLAVYPPANSPRIDELSP
jgi:hypothetical protein